MLDLDSRSTSYGNDGEETWIPAQAHTGKTAEGEELNTRPPSSKVYRDNARQVLELSMVDQGRDK